MPKVVFLTPTFGKPFEAYGAAMLATLPALQAAGWEHGLGIEQQNPYISAARANLLRKGLDTNPDCMVFIDHDLSWSPESMVKLLNTEGDVVAGTYRFKKDDEEYMGAWSPDETGRPMLRADGAINATRVPAGFLKITPKAVEQFMAAWPELRYGDADHPSVDMFNHGVIDGVWYGEDYAFCKRWKERCGDIWIVPDLDIAHNAQDRVFSGNLHEFLCRQPGGSKARIAA